MRFFVLGLTLMTSFFLVPVQAERSQTTALALVPFEVESQEKAPETLGPLGSFDNPYQLLQLIREPKYIKPGSHVLIPMPSGEELMLLPTSDGITEYSPKSKWNYTKDLLKLAEWELPTKLPSRNKNINSIKVTGVASTYGRNDGFAGQLTSSGNIVDTSTAALQMDLAHVLSDLGVVPFSMRGVKATLTMPGGRQVTKNLEDKGGLVNYLGESYWREAVRTMAIDEHGVGTLAPLPGSRYRVVDIFTQSRSTLIPNVTVEIHLKCPLVRKVDLTPSERQAWLQTHFVAPESPEQSPSE